MDIIYFELLAANIIIITKIITNPVTASIFSIVWKSPNFRASVTIFLISAEYVFVSVGSF